MIYGIALGSNLGDRTDNLRSALKLIHESVPGAVIRAACIYETLPVDCARGTQAFLNTAIELEADIQPHDLHTKLKSIESQLGRPTLHERNSPRTIDLDILHAGPLTIEDETLTVPHPRLHQRRLLLQPMADLNPSLQLPNQAKTIAELLAALEDDPNTVKAFPTPLPHLAALRERKRIGPKIAVLTAYDYPTARLLDEAGVDLILVGDSLGMVVHGLPDTTGVTMDMMVMHTAAVCRGVKRAPVIADLPFASYRTPEEALTNAHRLMDCGAAAVKLEGGAAHLPEIKAIIAAGIPFVGHIGMLPQSVKEGGLQEKRQDSRSNYHSARRCKGARSSRSLRDGARKHRGRGSRTNHRLSKRHHYWHWCWKRHQWPGACHAGPHWILPVVPPALCQSTSGSRQRDAAGCAGVSERGETSIKVIATPSCRCVYRGRRVICQCE